MKNHIFTFALLCLGTNLFSQIYVNDNAGGSNNGSSWMNAYTSLTAAIGAAEAGDEIWVAAGTYWAGTMGSDPATTYFSIETPLTIHGGFAGTESSLDDRDVGANPTILSGDLNGDDIADDFTTNRTDNGLHVIFLAEEAEGTVVDGFVIESGATKTGNPPMNGNFDEWAGGGLFSLCSSTIKNCTFRQNSGNFGAALGCSGGEAIFIENCTVTHNESERGAFALDSHLSADVVDCVFSENHATVFGGGGLAGNTNANFQNCSFVNNTCTGDVGGGLFIFQNNEQGVDAASIHLSGCSFVGNSAQRAGGLAFNNFAQNTALSVTDCLFENNAAEGGDATGGAFFIRNSNGDIGLASMTASFSGTTFQNNAAEYGAGGMVLCRNFTVALEMTDCDFTENAAMTDGGGLRLLSENNGSIEANLTDVLFKENNANVMGAGLMVVSSSDPTPIEFTLTGCIFEKNGIVGLGAGLACLTPIIGTFPGPIGHLSGCSFIENNAGACCGGIYATGSELNISGSRFEGNSTGADLTGGGAIGITENAGLNILRSTFAKNTSAEFGAAISQGNGGKVVFLGNVLFNENEGESTIYVEDSLSLRNVSMLADEAGIYAEDGAAIIFQNTILAEAGNNFSADGSTGITSLGGNLSNDHTLINDLKGMGDYADQHNALALLDDDFVPVSGSPCVDRGNPDGVAENAFDAAGEMRIQGDGIDIGGLESPFHFSSAKERTLSASVEVYPNPFTNVLNVESEEEPSSIQLFDMGGRLVANLPRGKTQVPMDENLRAGNYILEFVFENGTARKMVVKND